MAKVGDTVRFLNSTGGGRIVRIDGNIAYVDEDGFETPVLLKECVIVAAASDAAPKPAPTVTASGVQAPPPAPTKDTTPVDEPIVVEETAAGERLTMVLAYEASDLKRLSRASYSTYLVNDSNYFLYFTYLTRSNDSEQWTARYTGEVEPGIVLYIGQLTADDLPEISRVAVQMIAFKKDKPFSIKPPVFVERRLDVTKLCKLHCFRPNQYFDDPVIALDLVTDDLVVHPVEVDAPELERAMRTKISADRRPAAPKPRSKGNNPAGDLVVDLHINELLDNTNGLRSADMLNRQIDEFRRVMDANLRNHGRKIIFIHGKGDGVLRQALLKELNHRYKGHDVQDASFREYGYGATQVRIK